MKMARNNKKASDETQAKLSHCSSQLFACLYYPTSK